MFPGFELFDFDLPDGRIAREPAEPADSCRLLVASSDLVDSVFYKLPDFLAPGDLLVANNTRVEARRIAMLSPDGTIVEVLLVEELPGLCANCWKILFTGMGKAKDGDVFLAVRDESFSFRIRRMGDAMAMQAGGGLSFEDFNKIGDMPIPPYFKRSANDKDSIHYQNPFGWKGGSAAAPTAALHFTDSLVHALKEKGIGMEFLTLNVGYGTFAPLTAENFAEKKLHAERYELPTSLARILSAKKYKRLIAIGTTTLRVLENVHRETLGHFDHSLSGSTQLFVHPPDTVQSVDGLITNFHIPKSSLLLLVASLYGSEKTMNAYRHAIDTGYRFYSYGDAMLVLNERIQ